MKAFIFDMDGVIVDTQKTHTEALIRTFAFYGVTVPAAELAPFAGTKRGTALKATADKRGLSLPLDELCDKKDEIFNEMIARTELVPIDGIPELLAALRKAGIKTAIASSSSEAFIALVVDRLNIRPYFDALISGQTLPESKPNPAIYRLAARTLGVEPADCVVLEDAALGVAAAKGAGMRCIGFRNPNSGAQDLSAADSIVDDIRAIDIGRW
ncbi:MAG: HAD family phosphatase [Schwartzia sp.]|nr:HAD family phosphatase [Schwartzia sp. (in: firmicutes)]